MAKGAKTGGRAKGTLNKATADIKEAARKHGPEAIKVLATLMVKAETDQARIAAANALLDRGYGKATQHIAGADDEPPMQTVHRIELTSPNG